MERPLPVRAKLPSLRHHYGRTPREYVPADCGPRERRRTPEASKEQLGAVLCRLKARSPHFRNVDFRLAFTEYALRNGTLAAALRMAPPLQIRRASQPGGVACAAERRSVVEVSCNLSALDAALDLQEAAHLMKPGLIFGAHPTDGKAALCCYEEKELLARTNWPTAFVDAATCTSLGGGEASGSEGNSVPCLDAGSPTCLFAEQITVLRKEGHNQLDGTLVSSPKELPAAVCFLPRTMEDGEQDAYKSRTDRLEYRRQVEAALKVCCLLHLDGICIGCTEGIAGSEFFGHPLREAAQVWRDALLDRGPSGADAPLAAHFKRVVFVS
eukprot:CAMPEP_0179021494 /NCGR_PEP_ID=MMETSP0796-20121207/5921_1 /TAXON_ID=73915 /ORGANISM="Pyrodinium bahamense, Strain pbaha01" /LENGTH=326 /DNA_ID=CAMNT_0020717331 /DNA_START=28 /DNA_END=1005 /DNA_ORIENTATION=+